MRFKLPEGSKYGFYGFAAGAVIAMVVGFNWGGWSTAGTTEKMIHNASRAAVTEALVPYCVEAASREPDKLAAFPKEEDTYKQRSYIGEKTSWAIKKGQQSHDYELAAGCAAAIAKQQVAAAAKAG